MLSNIRKNDKVYVISGRDKGKEGKVIEVDSKNNRVLVKGISIVSKHKKAKKHGEQSSIVQKESYIPQDKIMPICSTCKKACRVRAKAEDGKKKIRVCHRCNKEL